MALKLSELAPELLHCVFCFCSRNNLASLSRVNYAFRKAAEYLLYRDIRISDIFSHRTLRKMSLFCTLTSNPQRAALLRYLHVELASNGSEPTENSNYRILKQIVEALQNVHGLEDLRIIVERPEHVYQPSDPSRGMLSEVIKGGYFQLHTLYCDSYQDLEGIIVSQKRLRLLGIYTNNYRSGCVNVSKLISNSRIDSNRNFPGIFMLFCSKSPYNINRLILFPEFCLPGQTFTLCKDIATSLGRDLGKDDVMPPEDRHRRLTIQVFDFSYAKTTIICEVVEGMAQYFANCEVFTVWVQTSVGNKTVSRPWKIPGVWASINRFEKLKRLNFYVPNDASEPSVALCGAVDDLKLLLYEEFSHPVGLNLVRACVDDYSEFVEIAQNTFSGWNDDASYIKNRNEALWNPNTKSYDDPLL